MDLDAEYGWKIVSGTAVFDGTGEAPRLRVEAADGGTRVIEAGQYLIATGATPWIAPIDGLAEAGYLTSTTAMDVDRLPESLIVIGGNAVGLEQAQLFARLGTRVTVIETLDRLAPGEEPEISAAIEAVFADEHIEMLTAAPVEKVLADDGHTVVNVRTGAGAGVSEVRAEQVLVATGRRPTTAELGLEAVGVSVDERGAVIVDDRQRTGNARIWAAGDVAGGPQFVYVAADPATPRRGMTTDPVTPSQSASPPNIGFHLERGRWCRVGAELQFREVSGASSGVAIRKRSGRASLWMVRRVDRYCLVSGPVV